MWDKCSIVASAETLLLASDEVAREVHNARFMWIINLQTISFVIATMMAVEMTNAYFWCDRKNCDQITEHCWPNHALSNNV